MAVNIEQFGIDRLSVADRLELIQQIWDSLPAEVQPGEVSEWHAGILAKRLADDERNAAEWEAKIAEDERAGRLDHLAERALAEHRAGRTRPL